MCGGLFQSLHSIIYGITQGTILSMDTIYGVSNTMVLNNDLTLTECRIISFVLFSIVNTSAFTTCV